MELYGNEFFVLTSNDMDLFISVKAKGFDIKNFNNLVLDYPTFNLGNFSALKRALEEAKDEPIKIGKIKPRIEVAISGDEMKVSIRLNITASEFINKKVEISSEIVEVLRENGIVDGFDNLFSKPISVCKDILVATGIPPVHGENAKISYYKISEKKPIINDDGKANHYELKLIDNIKKGDWLAEKIKPTLGRPGRTVTGKIIKPMPGQDERLKFDTKTVEEVEEQGVVVLRAKCDGAINIENGKVRIDNHLVIPSDVGYETGNVEFDGYITINGSVKDNFSVVGKYDISINGEMGIGAVSKIVSKEGSIFIKGGVYGKSIAVIEAKKNVFIKYTNECTIIAGEDINIGFYSIDSTLKARRILLDPKHGRVLGGHLTAQAQIVSGTFGSKQEKKTIISVQGFDRAEIKKSFDNLLLEYKEILDRAATIRRNIEVIEYNLSGSEYSNMEEYKDKIDEFDRVMEELNILNYQRIKLQQILETKGDGEVGIFKAAFPETYLEIKNMSKKIESVVFGSFFAQDKELHFK